MGRLAARNLKRGAIVLLGFALGGCMQTYQEPFREYAARIDTITLGAGNDHAANTRLYAVDPWPAYAGDVRLPSSGERMAGAVARSRDVSQLPKTPEPLALETTRK